MLSQNFTKNHNPLSGLFRHGSSCAAAFVFAQSSPSNATALSVAEALRDLCLPPTQTRHNDVGHQMRGIRTLYFMQWELVLAVELLRRIPEEIRKRVAGGIAVRFGTYSEIDRLYAAQR